MEFKITVTEYPEKGRCQYRADVEEVSNHFYIATGGDPIFFARTKEKALEKARKWVDRQKRYEEKNRGRTIHTEKR